jgi:anti-sigma factor RsiW
MSHNVHARAEQLMDAWKVEGISAADREWLDGHLEECARCRARAQANERALQALRSLSMRVSPELVKVTQARVHLRASELNENQVRLRALWISCALSWILGVASAPLVWRAFEWVGHYAALPNVIWEAGFVLWWLLPAGGVAALLAWQHQRAGSVDDYTNLPR